MPTQAIPRTVATLSRWDAFCPGSQLPESVEAMTLTQSLQLRAADPELYALMAGQAPAELERAVLAGT